MRNERRETTIFMAENGERISLVHPEREAKQQPASRDKSVRPHGGGQPPERTSSDSVKKDEKPFEMPAAPELTAEQQEQQEKQEKIAEHIEEGRFKEGIGMILEEGGKNPEEELEKPEMQKMLQDLDVFKEEMSKPEEERDMDKLQSAYDSMRGAPKDMQDILRSVMGKYGMTDADVNKLLPRVPAAPTEEGEGGEKNNITAPTEEDQRKEVEAIVKPFADKIQGRIDAGDIDGAKDEMMKIPWGKIVGRSFQAAAYAAIAAYVAYIFLMAKTGNAVKK